MEWISVKDRLPAEEGEYLVVGKLEYYDSRWYAHHEETPENAITFHARWTGEDFQSCYESMTRSSTIAATHWMPLPQPPKEQDGK